MMDRGQWAHFEFLITTESQDLGLTSLPKYFLLFDRIVSASLYWGINATQTTG